MKILDSLGFYIENHHAVVISIFVGICGLGFFIWHIMSLANEDVSAQVIPNKAR